MLREWYEMLDKEHEAMLLEEEMDSDTKPTKKKKKKKRRAMKKKDLLSICDKLTSDDSTMSNCCNSEVIGEIVSQLFPQEEEEEEGCEEEEEVEGDDQSLETLEEEDKVDEKEDEMEVGESIQQTAKRRRLVILDIIKKRMGKNKLEFSERPSTAPIGNWAVMKVVNAFPSLLESIQLTPNPNYLISSHFSHSVDPHMYKIYLSSSINMRFSSSYISLFFWFS